MAINFPDNRDQLVPPQPSGPIQTGDVYVFNGTTYTATVLSDSSVRWDAAVSAGSDAYVLKVGDTMTGQLTLPGGGTGNEAATVSQIPVVPAALWQRTGTTLSPVTADDNIDQGAGNITTTGDVSAANFTATGDVQTTSLNGGPLSGLRNQLINGNFQFNQRGQNEITSAGYLFDRWFWDGTGSYTRGVNAPLGQAFSASFAAGSTGRLQQAVELPVAGKPGPFVNGSQWTLSLYAKQGTFADLTTLPIDVFFRRSSTSGTDAVRAVNPAPSFTVTSETSNGFARYVCTFNIDADPHSSSECITFRFGIQSAIGAVQLEPGPVATPFSQRPISQELAMCQRYYYAFNTTFSGPGNYAAANSTGLTIFNYVASPQFRAVPSITLNRTGAISGLAGEPTLGQASTTGYYITADKNGGAGSFNWQGVITADAEL